MLINFTKMTPSGPSPTRPPLAVIPGSPLSTFINIRETWPEVLVVRNGPSAAEAVEFYTLDHYDMSEEASYLLTLGVEI